MSGIGGFSAPINEGTSGFAAAAPAAGVTTLIAPASNLNGVDLVTASIQAGNMNMAFYGDTAAPASATDTAKRAVFRCDTNAQVELPFPIRLPPGTGLYFAAAGTPSGQVFCTYTIR